MKKATLEQKQKPGLWYDQQVDRSGYSGLFNFCGFHTGSWSWLRKKACCSSAVLHWRALLMNWCQQWPHRNRTDRRQGRPLTTRHIHCVSWSLHLQSKYRHVARFVICPCLVVLDEGPVLAQVDLIRSLCDLGNAQETTLHWANFPDDTAALSLIRSASHRPLTSRTDGISRFGRYFVILRLHSILVGSTASCYRVPQLLLRNCRQWLRSSPFLAWCCRQQLAPGSCCCHFPGVIREPCRGCRVTHVAWSIAVDFAICESPRSIQLH